MVELGSLMTANRGFSIIATMLFGNIISSFCPVRSLYTLTFTVFGYHSSTLPVRNELISYEPVTVGSSVVSTGTIATQPSSSIDMTTSWINDLPVWSILASTDKHLSNELST